MITTRPLFAIETSREKTLARFEVSKSDPTTGEVKVVAACMSPEAAEAARRLLSL